MTQSLLVQALNPVSFPLHGVRLIEASAGTGKTYTITSLYLRLLLGHGEESSAHPVPLSVDQILVVTFTEAATEELRDRIRAKIHEARIAFSEGETDDSFLQQLLNDLDRHKERADLLLAAERQMDEAAVFTIHGFCQRMLKQHAFESGTLFSSELIRDETQLLQQTTADFWRKTLYPLDKPTAKLARQLWKTPSDLLLAIRGWLGKTDLEVLTAGLPDSMEAFQRDYIDPALAIKALWQQDQDEIENCILSAGLKKSSKPVSRLERVSAFLKSDTLAPDLNPGKSPKESWEIYNTSSLEKALTKNGKMPQHPVFPMIDELTSRSHSLLSAFKGMILKSALENIQIRLTAIKAEKHQLSFDDLLRQLATALKSKSGDTLSEAIRGQFRVAMIDEFQDTDPQQYSIFSQIYPLNNEDSSAGLFMIGDPKQAIYAFRGADIFTYMKARQQVTAHYSLDTNWRSTSSMIHGVNRIFEFSDQPFIYDEIPFDPVKPSPIADKRQLLDQGNPVAALQLWAQEADDVAIGKAEYEKAMTLATANEVNRLLTAARDGECLIQTSDGNKALQANDIAVLVRTGRQGQMIREALAHQGIPSVYLSSNDSVFTQQEAVDVYRLLAACLTPTHDRTLRAALACPLLNMTAEALDALNIDEQAWEAAVEEFSDYHQLWLSQGVLPMLRTLISRRGIAEQLLANPFGERRLTDLLHVGELLASASQELESPHALLRWLSDHIQNPDSNADEQQLHLESERNLVKIVTIHKSKGLEYDVVFLPYACNFREANDPVFHENNRTQLDLSADSESLEKADKERLAEDLRLLYVALTRSVHTCYAGLAPLKTGPGKKGDKTDLHKSALGWLLNSGDIVKTSDLSEKLQHLTEAEEGMTISAPPLAERPPYKPPVEDELELNSRTFNTRLERDWWVTSYSSLSRSAHSSSAQSGSPSNTTPDASQELAGHDMEVQTEAEEPVLDELSIFNFPKGARPGTFLHTLFEGLNSRNSQPENLPPYITDLLLQEGFEEKWADTLSEMLQHCLEADLDGQGLSLGRLPDHAKKVEVEFYLPISRLKSGELNTLLASEDPLSARAGTLDFPSLKGMLKGFIDLTFEHQGRWYVLDYKSNWLGDQLKDYQQDAMETVMVEHRYDLQYQLYSLALHRQLKARLPDYDFEQHFGGVFYLFLRGIRMNDNSRPGIYQCRPSHSLIDKLDKLFAGEASC